MLEELVTNMTLRKLSIRNKIFISYLSIALVLSVLVVIIGSNILNSNYVEILTEELNEQNKQIEKVILTNRNDIKTELQNISDVLSKRITVIDKDGVVTFDSFADVEKLDNHIDRPEVQQSMNSDYGISIRFSDSVGFNMLYLSRRINHPIGKYLRISVPLRDLDSIKHNFQMGILETLTIIFLLILVLSYILSSRFYKPLKELTDASDKVAKGDMNVEVHFLTGDEFETVGNSFNKMINEVKSNVYSIEQQKAELSGIISSLSECLWVINKTGNIVISNPSCQRVLNLSTQSSEGYWHQIKDATILDMIGETLNRKTNIIKPITLGDHDYIFSSSYLAKYERAIFIMQDVSEIKQVERMKQDFIVNMAHELRTPITAIKGFAEMLESSVPEEKRRFLKIIRNHSDRLANLVEDIQVLINLEQMGKLNLENVKLKKFAENIKQLYEHKTSKSNVELIVEVEEPISDFYADIYKLDQIFINLIDNAMRYTTEGHIKLSISKDDTGVEFKVEDTGCGIESKHLERLFERFYVADKARSRKMGGTGLGLAIVKHIVMLHNGTVNVNSTVGKGTTFTIKLPFNLK